jgi:preprotein translocase subunit YajC
MTFLNVFFMMGAPSGDDGGLINLLFLGALFFVFYFFIIRPQSKRQKEVKKKLKR